MTAPHLGTSEAQIHELADVQSSRIGSHTRIWQFTVVLPGAVIGERCNICSHCFIENDVAIGNDVTVKSGVYLWDGICLEDQVFVGPNVTFTNDRMPRSGNRDFEVLRTVVERGASLGAGCVILPGLRIGCHAMVAAGSVVTRDVPPRTLVAGNPARPIRALAPDDGGSP